MSPAESPIESLAEHARETRVVVIGGGIAGLVAALECAKVGMRVTLLEESDELGGAIRSRTVDDVVLPVGADGYATTGGHVRALVDELELTDLVRPEAPLEAWVAGVPGGPAPLPVETVLGIPANPWDPTVRRIIGWGGVWRAYLDRLRPPLTIGQQNNLDTLVRGRMGGLVVDRLVAPLSVGRHGLLPSEVDVEIAAPGLGSALTRTGSLGGGVAQLRGSRADAPAYETLEGGLAPLVEALTQRLHDYGVDVRTGARVEAIERGWRVRLDDEERDAEIVVVAASVAESHRLLAPHVAAVVPETPRTLDVVTLVVDGDLPARAVYAVPGSGPLTAVSVVSSRWPWLTALLGDGRSVVRATLASAPADDAAAIAEAEAAASVALGVGALAVRDARIDRLATARPRSARGHVDAAARVRAAVSALPGLGVVGAGVAGSGLAQVIPDAVAEAERLRRGALFGA
ncbi:protoporphyrinogen oxidase [Microbacterium aoyamense]|uniref:Protoporphyrinogen oxidase n=1 Tax=Microbacterium aoyamense TaxID=344166 RepID=A0ABP5AYJ7_9MICO|nr:FAD-dependent oxidoreductase [Microbacterium aoyamense]